MYPFFIICVGIIKLFWLLYPRFGFWLGISDAFLLPYPRFTFWLGISDAFGFPYPRLIFHMGILRDFISLCPILENLINTVRPFEPAIGSFSGCQATKLKLRLRLVSCLGSVWALHVPASLNSSFASLGLIKCPGTVRTKLKLRHRLVFVKCSTWKSRLPGIYLENDFVFNQTEYQFIWRMWFWIITIILLYILFYHL